MGGALAEQFALQGAEVIYVTPHNLVSAWTEMTNEQMYIQKRLIELGVKFQFARSLKAANPGLTEWSCTYTGQPSETECEQLVLVTGRSPRRGLYDDLIARQAEWADHGIQSVSRIGDCLVPSTIADAVYRGHRFARELEEPLASQLPKRERPKPLIREGALT
ncbi:MAG: hypothetical protein GY953_35340 [bacterium]|nr:hypothetical protein [bacterium]